MLRKGGHNTKRRDLIKMLECNGWYLKRSGANHDIYTDGVRCEAIPRRAVISKELANAIIKRNGLK